MGWKDWFGLGKNKDEPAEDAFPHLVYARLNHKLEPMARGDRYEEPLQDFLEDTGLGEVSGGGTMLTGDGGIESCGVDIDVADLDVAVPRLVAELTRLGAPTGSSLQFTRDGEEVEVAIGDHEGLGLHLDGTGLADEVYESFDPEAFWEQVDVALGGSGGLHSWLTRPSESLLCCYGPSFEAMKAALGPLVAEAPICGGCRLEQIA